MNILNITIIKSLLQKCFQQHYLLGKTITYLPENWQDNEGNNLFHYAALHHDLSLFEKALNNNANINQKNNNGILPIHRFIECGFVEPEKKMKGLKQNLIDAKNNLTNNIKHYTTAQPLIDPLPEKVNKSFRVLDFNIDLLKKFIEHGADVNAFLSNDIAHRSTLSQTHNIRNHKGSAIELLIQLFYSNVLYDNFNDQKLLNQYYEVYEILSNAGANINLLEEENIGNDSHLDAMQISNKFIASNYFISYLKYNSQFYTIMPILADPTLDFSLKDSQSNTVLHNLFGRIYARHASLEHAMVQQLFQTIVKNPSFDKKYLEIENSFRLKPIKILKKESIIYAELFEKFVLYNALDSKLPTKPQETRKRKI